MATEILMPALSPTMEEGKLAKWLIKEGQDVKAGDVIAEIETDKATMEVEAVDEGKVGKLLVAEGTEGVRVNTPIAVLIGEGESAAAPSSSALPAPTAAGAPATAAKAPPAAAPAKPQSKPQAPTAASAAPAAKAQNGSRILASPLARRLAHEAGLDLAALAGSGPHGRIVKSDVETAARSGAAPKSGTAMVQRPGTAAAPPPVMADAQILALYDKSSYEIVPHDNMRKTIAQRLTLSKQTTPHFRLSVDCRIDDLLKARERMNAASPKDGPRAYKLSVNDFVIKALALALAQVPAANVTWTEAGTLRHRYSDIGVAVAIEGGLFTPIIRHAELKSLSEISNEMRDLAERARKRRLAPHEYQGGTTSISNLGMYGIKSFDAVINPPHATILAVGTGEKRAVVAGDTVAVATLMTCTLSCDHRVVDGAIGAELLTAFKALIEDPVRMLV
ncbi:MAG TPA: pyruvate dehydrogenase complex dihydrolipoamide acetyltransferase [Hyphomicrobiaceae bacterium]|nr:pyruvate dehydrogenase complex dihydrolipoamide acetyltransferase [Hyphomicrobiaceae bacterium]